MNIKKKISMVLVLAMVLTMFSGFAYAESNTMKNEIKANLEVKLAQKNLVTILKNFPTAKDGIVTLLQLSDSVDSADFSSFRQSDLGKKLVIYNINKVLVKDVLNVIEANKSALTANNAIEKLSDVVIAIADLDSVKTVNSNINNKVTLTRQEKIDYPIDIVEEIIKGMTLNKNSNGTIKIDFNNKSTINTVNAKLKSNNFDFRIDSDDTTRFITDLSNLINKNIKSSDIDKLVKGFNAIKVILNSTPPTQASQPQDKLTRAQFTELLVDTLEIEKVTSKGEFKDVNANHWAKDYIAVAKQLGIVVGYADGTFRPDQFITRAEAAVILTNSLKLQRNSNAEVINQFSDGNQVPAWAVEYIVPPVIEKILLGINGEISPLGNITREEADNIIYRIYNR